jgi:hypothetical protein
LHGNFREKARTGCEISRQQRFPNYRKKAMDIRHLVALTTVLALAGPGAFAQAAGSDRDWYFSVDYGDSKLDSTGSLVNAASRHDKSDAFSIRFGYRFSRKFALEAGYIDFGDFSATFVAACPACSGRRSSTSIKGYLVNVIGIWPIHEHFQLKGALGTTYRELEATAVYPTMTDHWSDSGRVYNFAAGICIPINERFEVGLDHTLYRENGWVSVTLSPRLGFIDDGEFSLTTLALRYRF